MAICVNSYALSESEAEDMADLTAILAFLKSDRGYQNLPDGQIRRALVFSTQQNQRDLGNYDTFDMRALGKDSYHDLSGIGIPVAKECEALARDPLSLLTHVKQSLVPLCRNIDHASAVDVSYYVAPFFYGC